MLYQFIVKIFSAFEIMSITQVCPKMDKQMKFLNF